MPPQPTAAAGVAPAPGGQAQPAGQNMLGMVVRMGLMWYMMNWMKGGQQPKTPAEMAKPIWARGDLLDVHVYLSEQPYLRDRNSAELLWHVTDIQLAVSPERNETVTYNPSEAVKNNGSVYLHAYFSRSGTSLDEDDSSNRDTVFVKTHPLIMYLPRPKNKTGVNLLGGETAPITSPSPPSEPQAPREWVSFFKPNVTIALVDHFQGYPRNGIPPQIRDHMTFNAEGDYLPLVYFDDFWLLRDKMVAMNDSVGELQLHLSIAPASFWWMQLKQQMSASFDLQLKSGLTQDGEADEIKRIFLEGNPVLLAITMVVSLLHSVFDFLAFKNDIGFWRQNKSMEGLSARSILFNAVCQLIIFLYLLDNETSMVVLASSGIGAAIEFWKVTKAMHVTVDLTRFPFIKLADRASYHQSDTDKYDAQAMRYLSYALFPLVGGYSIYALLYETHRSWYSWVLGSLVGAVYAFGFILMCPQLYLNYRLKSVAHLPWRQMTYKFLNTIIDDLFAFVIKMPTLHRLSVFRDDVIFLIYLYQRWIYRVDPKRVNEFGFAQEALPGSDEAAAAGQAAIEGAPQEVVQAEETAGGEGGSSSVRRRGGAAAGDSAEGAAPAAAESGSKKQQ